MIESFLYDIMHLQPIYWVVICLFCTVFLLKSVYLILFTGRILFRVVKPLPASPTLSLLLPFRNEAENLMTYLPGILKTGNTGYEVMAVDDFSQDNSLIVLGALKEKYKNLRISSLNQETRYSEKVARNIALKGAKNEWVMIIPPAIGTMGSRWPAGISSRLSDHWEVVIGYFNLCPRKEFKNRLLRVEYFFRQLKSYGFILNGLPFIGFEENVAFRKTKYFESGGFRRRIKEPYANLELVINTFIRKNTTDIVFSAETAFRKEINGTGNAFREMVKKEMRIYKHLSFSKRFFLGFERILTAVFLPVTALAFLLLPWLWPFFAFLLLTYVLAFSFIIKSSLNRLNEPNLFLSSLMIGLFLPYLKLGYQGIFYLSDQKRKWRSRK